MSVALPTIIRVSALLQTVRGKSRDGMVALVDASLTVDTMSRCIDLATPREWPRPGDITSE
jgi:hypothetical protein